MENTTKRALDLALRCLSFDPNRTPELDLIMRILDYSSNQPTANSPLEVIQIIASNIETENDDRYYALQETQDSLYPF